MNKKIVLGSFVIIFAIILIGQKYGFSSWKMPIKKDIGQEAAKTKAIDFVKNNLVAPGTEVNTKEIAKEGELYRIVFTVGKQDITTYMTADGTKFFPSVMNIADVEKQSADQKVKDEAAAKDVPKTDKPTVDLYVMAFCPFGNKAENTMKPVYNLLKNKVDFNFRYIISSSGDTIQSLHGDKEVVQDEREVCVLQDYGKDKWMDFVTYVNDSCGSDGSCWETAAENSGLDKSKINNCVSSNGTNLLKTDEKAANDAGATGSPTMFINGAETKVVYKYGNSEEYKQAICNAFNSAPEECSQQLSSETSTAQGGSCGN
ncbi:MAG TPA: hypothetical protein VK255_00710 [Patescibacteria group bacterium]|nr:hypothetical protein [Patescibacteria group bacterium]